MVTELFPLEPSPETNVKVNWSFASGSIADKRPTTVPAARFSLMDEVSNAMFEGVSFTSRTVMVNVWVGPEPERSMACTATW